MFASIVYSTIWAEEMDVKIVWMTMLAISNRHGEVIASPSSLALVSRVSRAQCDAALARLSSAG